VTAEDKIATIIMHCRGNFFKLFRKFRMYERS